MSIYDSNSASHNIKNEWILFPNKQVKLVEKKGKNFMEIESCFSYKNKNLLKKKKWGLSKFPGFCSTQSLIQDCESLLIGE